MVRVAWYSASNTTRECVCVCGGGGGGGGGGVCVCVCCGGVCVCVCVCGHVTNLLFRLPNLLLLHAVTTFPR